MSTQPFVYRAFRFINQKLLRNTWEDSIAKVQKVTSIKSRVVHSLKYRMRTPLRLVAPNSVFTFPLASRYTHQDKDFNSFGTYMFIKKGGIGSTPMSTPQVELANMAYDHSKSALNVLGFVRTLRVREMEQLEKIWTHYAIKDVSYSKSREVIFAQGIVNGENPFLLRRLRHDKFEIESSRLIYQTYLNELDQAFSTEKLSHQNLKIAGLDAEQLKERIKKGDAYAMFFEDLEQVSGGKTLSNKPTIVLGNSELGEEYFLQSPFAVFMKVGDSILNVAIGFRYTLEKGQQVTRFFSPFFESQPEKVWRLAQSHLGSAIFTDFQWRVHLGEFHFSTEQFNVPIYNYLTSASDPKHNIESFFKYGFTPFNLGLESTNALVSPAVIQPAQDYSPIQTTVNLNQQNALLVMANHANRLNFAKRSPEELVAEKGISKQSAIEDFQLFGLHFKFYRIISQHISTLWDIFEMDGQKRVLMVAINKDIDRMVVNGGQRRAYITQEQVLPLLTNLVYTWIGYHANTFSGVVAGNYWGFRPSMLTKEVPYQPQKWTDMVVGEEIPHTKTIMEGLKLSNLTTQRDSDYTLLSILKKQAFAVREENNMGMAIDSAKHEKLQVALEKVVTQLKAFDEEVSALNCKKQAADKIEITWLNPSDMQSSLNT